MGYENNLITHCFLWSQRTELNRRPTDYESVALPLSYAGIIIGGNLEGGTLTGFVVKNQPQNHTGNPHQGKYHLASLPHHSLNEIVRKNYWIAVFQPGHSR
jgi:hypothetical protein